MYWEEFWDALELAANTKVEDMNSEFKFHFMLHADKKSKSKWKDMPLPFPARQEKGQGNKTDSDKSGLDQLPAELRGLVYRPDD
jgi:hypothetical protein